MICLTDEQRRIVTENHNLIYSFLRDKNQLAQELDTFLGEDCYSIVAIGLCKAAAMFDETRGYSFSTFAYKVMNNEMLAVFRKYKAQKAIPQYLIQSYESIIPAVDNDKTTIADLCLVDKQDKYEDLITTISCEKTLETLSERDKQIIHLLILGYKQEYIGKKFAITQSTVSRIKGKFIKKLKACYG